MLKQSELPEFILQWLEIMFHHSMQVPGLIGLAASATLLKDTIELDPTVLKDVQ